MLHFVRLSGDNPDIGLGEARALCEARAGGFSLVERSGLAAVVECPADLDLADLGGFISESGRLLWRGPADSLDVGSLMLPSPLGPAKADAEGFGGERNLEMARSLGEALWRAGAELDLRRPSVVLKAYRFGDVAYVALVRPRRKGRWSQRDLRLRPFRHPSMLVPRLARALVNLSRPRPRGLFLDPFSGTGSVLAEAEYVGCLPVGVDVDWRMARGSLDNMRWFRSAWGIVRGDSRSLPVRRADCVASDLPYGRMSSARGSTTDELLADLVSQLPAVLGPGGHAALMVRERVEPVIASGVELRETYLHRVHDALTRKILVYRVTAR